MKQISYGALKTDMFSKEEKKSSPEEKGAPDKFPAHSPVSLKKVWPFLPCPTALSLCFTHRLLR